MKKKFVALAAVAAACFFAGSPASEAATASPMWNRVSCYGPFSVWPVKIVHYGWDDQCFQFPNGGGETLYSNDYYDEVWSGSYRIIVYYQGKPAHSLNPQDSYKVPGGLLQKIVVIG